MNNINCEHCGSLINTDKDIKCPNCGAPYKNNKQYKEYLAYQKKQRELNLETQQIANNITKDVHNASQKAIPAVFIIVIAIFLISFAFFFIIFRQAFSSMDDYQEKYNDYINNKEQIEMLQKDHEKIYIFFNEYAYTDQFDIKVDNVIDYTETKYEKNKHYYGFHIVFKNKTRDWKTLSDIRCTYLIEGEERSAGKEIVSAKELDFFAKDIQTYDGYLYYDIPEEVKDVTLVFGDINITIFDFKHKIK